MRRRSYSIPHGPYIRADCEPGTARALFPPDRVALTQMKKYVLKTESR